MPDDPSTPAKKETFRINIPSPGSAGETQDLGALKKETVKISIPKRPDQPGSGPLPTTTSVVPPAAPAVPAAPGRPFVPPPPPPKPPGAASAPVPPPPAAPRPPAPPAPPKAPEPAAAPVTMKAAQPKKETARIQLPPEPKPLPKATVRMQQTQPLAQTPAAQASSAAITKVAAPMPAAEDSGSVGIAAAVLAISAIVLVIQILTLVA